MSYRTLLVSAGTGRSSQAQAALTFGLAKVFGAAVVGVGGDADVQAQSAFRERAAELECAAFWRADARPRSTAMIEAGSCTDLIVSGPTSERQPPDLAGLIFGCGPPVLLVPEGLDHLYPRTTAIGWKNTAAARRAITDAIPLLQKSERTILIGICENDGVIPAREEMDAVADRLGRRGIRCDVITAPQLHVSAADDLTNAARCRAADILVAGAFARSPWRDRIFGGVTKDLLADLVMPVLFSR